MQVLTAAILRDPRDAEPPVSEEKKATFYATAELNVRCLFLELDQILMLMIASQGRASSSRHTPSIDKV